MERCRTSQQSGLKAVFLSTISLRVCACMGVCVLGEVCPCEHRFPQMLEEYILDLPEAGVLGCCDLSDMGVGNITLVFCK